MFGVYHFDFHHYIRSVLVILILVLSTTFHSRCQVTMRVEERSSVPRSSNPEPAPKRPRTSRSYSRQSTGTPSAKRVSRAGAGCIDGPVPTGHDCGPGARADASIGPVPTGHECEPGARLDASIGPVPTGHECERGARFDASIGSVPTGHDCRKGAGTPAPKK